MPFTGIAFFENVDNAALSNVAALADTKYFVNGDDFIVPDPYNKIIATYALGDTTTRARLNSPSLLQKAPFEIRPFDNGTEPASIPPVHDLRANPLQLESDEALNAETTNSGAAAVDQYVFCWLADEVPTPITGADMFTIRATGTATAVADAWTNVSMTLGSDLRVGTYAVVGFRFEGATAIAARLIFPDDVTRPMVLGHDIESDIEHPMFRYGNLGEWGQFKQDRPPRVEILCAAADTAQTYELDLVRVA